MKNFRIVIAGGREFNDYKFLKRWCDHYIQRLPTDDIEVVSGKARGADSLGERWAKENGFPVKSFPADWHNLDVPGAIIKVNSFGEYNAAAGNMRNSDMADYGTHLIAFWNKKSTGTKDMIELAKMRGLKVRVVYYD